MGRGKGNRGGKQQHGKGESRESHGRYQQSVEMDNTKVEAYYRAQNIIDSAQLDAIFAHFRTPLPTTFRVTGSRANVEDVNDLIKTVHVPELSDVVYEGQKQDPPQQIPWYPGGLAWSFNVAKKVIRKSPEFKQFQSFLVHETDAGNLSRQEAVSMIPPLLLDVQPHHYVLDMCAAPGSKSAQLLEALHAVPDVDPTGFLLANDSDAKRCHMLIHQTLGRLGSPNMMVTNLDASHLPNFRIQDEKTGKTRVLQYDRILADVPCTGDGTLRKNVEIWKRWSVWEAIGIHALQLRILLRGLKNLKPGGRLVYSTCSLNPIENEAVVGAALRASRDTLSLVDVSDQITGLKRQPGLHTWRVLDDDLAEIPQPEAGANERQHKTRSIVSTVWPSGEEADLHLERCLRVYPHMQDTGGFFVAVLKKAAKASTATDQNLDAAVEATDVVAPEIETKSAKIDQADRVQVDEASTESAKPVIVTDGAPASDPEPPAKRQKLDKPVPADREGIPARAGTAKNPSREFREEPYGYIPPTNEEMTATLSHFGIDTSTFSPSNLLVRNARGEPLRTVYHTSTSVRHVVRVNDYTRMRLVGCGAKLFARQDTASKHLTLECRWRIMSDSVSMIRRHMTTGEAKRVVECGVETLRLLMDHYTPLEKLVEPDLRARLEKLGLGSAVVEVRPGTDEKGARLRSKLILPIWRADHSVQLMIEKKEKAALSYRVFGSDITTYRPPKGKEDKKAVKEEQVADADEAMAEDETAKNERAEKEVEA